MQNFRGLQQPTDRFIHLDNQEYLFFGGTAYLGLLANPDYIELYKKGIDLYGLNNGTSRSNNVQLGIYDAVEKRLAERFGFESSAILSSGYLAAQAAVLSLIGNKKVYYAPETHPSLWFNGNPQVAGNFLDWAISVVQEINSSTERAFVVVSNALDNLKPEHYDFSVFQSIDSDKHVLFILDDSHGIAVVNRDAISVDLTFAQHHENLDFVVLASLAKGLGTDAGVVLGNRQYIDQVKSHPIFMGASPSSPAAMHALLHGDSIYHQAFGKLEANRAYFKSALEVCDKEFHSCADFAVFTLKDAGLYRFLLQNNVLISSFPYPLPHSPLLNRIVISSLHEQEDLDKVAELCRNRSV